MLQTQACANIVVIKSPTNQLQRLKSEAAMRSKALGCVAYLSVLALVPEMQGAVEGVSHDHGAVGAHLAAVEAQSVAANLPYAHLA